MFLYRYRIASVSSLCGDVLDNVTTLNPQYNARRGGDHILYHCNLVNATTRVPISDSGGI